MDYEQIESSQKQHNETLRHSEAMIEAATGADYKQFAMIKPNLYKDGDKWCCLYGVDQIVGIVGFGNTPHEAILDWNSAWHRP